MFCTGRESFVSTIAQKNPGPSSLDATYNDHLSSDIGHWYCNRGMQNQERLNTGRTWEEGGNETGTAAFCPRKRHRVPGALKLFVPPAISVRALASLHKLNHLVSFAKKE
jgi:hypothetical protein